MHNLYDNKKSNLSSISEDFNTFENSYLALLDKAKGKLVEYNKEAHNPEYHPDAQLKCEASEHELAEYLIQIYKHFIDLKYWTLFI